MCFYKENCVFLIQTFCFENWKKKKQSSDKDRKIRIIFVYISNTLKLGVKKFNKKTMLNNCLMTMGILKIAG